jgi:Zn-dependent protease
MFSTLFSNPIVFFFSLIGLTVALTIHEFAHAWAADFLGDPTARLQGRMSLNPMVHIDKFGLLFILFTGFGWGKPVEFDPYNLKNPHKDAALISLAGPFSNILLAVVCSLLLSLLNLFQLSFLSIIGINILEVIIITNLGLGVFNLLPIHPLDGFKVVGGLLSEEKAREWYQLERYGMIFLLLLIVPLGQTPILYSIMDPILNFLQSLLIPAMKSGII